MPRQAAGAAAAEAAVVRHQTDFSRISLFAHGATDGRWENDGVETRSQYSVGVTIGIARAIGCLAATAMALIGGPLLLIALMFWLTAERTVYSRAMSPDGSHEARVQFDDCGATCGWAKGVFLKSAWLPLDTPHLSCAAFWGDGTDRVKLEWSDDSTLIIHHGFTEGSFDAAETCGSVSVEVRHVPELVSSEP
jgi:hypothetical protein